MARADDAADGEQGLQLDVQLPSDLASGDWNVGVIADPEGAVGDLDRENNVAFATAPLQVRNPSEDGPDLTVCNVGIPAFDQLPASAQPVAELGDQLGVSVCITNIGNRPVARFSYGLYLSEDEVFDSSDVAVGHRGDIALGPGDREDYQDLVDLDPSLVAGAWHLLVVVDPDDEVAERQEDNNDRGWPDAFQLASPGNVQGVDLAATSFAVDFTGDHAFWGQTLPGHLTVTNRGDTGVTRFFVVQVLAEPVDGHAAVEVGSANVASLDAHADTTVDVPVRITRRVPQGSYRLAAVIDPTNGVHDVNPGNNRRVLQDVLTLGGEPNVDAAVRQVQFDPAQIEAGGMLNVDAILANLGTDPTGALEAVVLLSPDGQRGPDAVEVDRFPVDNLNGGDQRPIERPVVVPVDLDQQVPSWRVGVVVDPGNHLSGELSEDNNVLFADGALTVTGAMGGCHEDAQFEENDDAAHAADLQPGSYPGLGLCDGSDWYRVQVPAGQVLDATVAWDEADGALTLTLADADGNAVRQGDGAPGSLRVFAEPAAADRALLLHVAAGGARLAYDLQVSVAPADVRPDLRVRAVTPVPAVVRPGSPVALSFEVANTGGSAAAPSSAAVYLVAGGAALDPQAAPIARIDVPAVDSGASAAVQGNVDIPAGTADGPYRLFVAADAGGAVDEADEANNVGQAALRVDSVQACAADPLEPNRSPFAGGGMPSSATLVPPGMYAGLATCRDDDDWYEVDLHAGERLDVTIDFHAADGDLDLELYDRDGQTLLGRSASLQDRESASILRAPADGRYHVRVFLAAGAAAVANTYGLTVAVSAANQCPDDAFEPNGSRDTALLLPDGMHALTLCPGDEDWFRFNIPAGNTVSFQLAGGNAGVQMTLFDPNDAQVDEDNRRIVVDARVSGFYRLRVRVDAGAAMAVGYQLTVQGVSGVDLALTGLTLTPAEAAPGGDLRATAHVQNDRGDAADGVVVRFWLSADDRPSADDLVLAEQQIAHVEGGADLVVRQRLTLPADAMPGDRFVLAEVDPDRRVADLSRANNRTSAALGVVAACVDDDDRDNEGPRTATPLDPADGAYDHGVICPATEDWFSLPVADAGQVTLRLTFDAGAGDLDLYVYAADGATLLGESATEGSPEAVDVQLDAPGTVLIRVDGFLDDMNSYRLDWVLP
jgi:uncharacterized membrane protein